MPRGKALGDAPFSHVRRLASKVKGAIKDPAGFLEKELKLSAVDKLELCLVCEVCWRPQRDGAYDVTTKSDLCAKVRRRYTYTPPRGPGRAVSAPDRSVACCSLPQVMPVAKATLYTIKAVNGLAGIAQCFFPGAMPGCRRGWGMGRALDPLYSSIGWIGAVWACPV